MSSPMPAYTPPPPRGPPPARKSSGTDARRTVAPRQETELGIGKRSSDCRSVPSADGIVDRGSGEKEVPGVGVGSIVSSVALADPQAQHQRKDSILLKPTPTAIARVKAAVERRRAMEKAAGAPESAGR